ncbi:MAG: hypothetical protein COB90_05630 [Hyphomicrobiales bacterium]|nr:MAG: hypothetical protein COB90_05630 [Hyphomicrobiales bacterium]
MRLMTYMALSLGALWALSSPVMAVTVNLLIESKGEPVPGAIISFETQDGEPIDADLFFEELAEVTADEPDNQTHETTPKITEFVADKPIPTAEDGSLTAELSDSFLDQNVVLVIRKDGKLVKRQDLSVSNEEKSLRIEAYDPIDAGIAIAIAQDNTCKRGKICEIGVRISNTGNGIYEGPLIVSGTLVGNWIKAAQSSDGWFCIKGRRRTTLCLVDVALEPGADIQHVFSVHLPRNIGRNPRNCFATEIGDETKGGKRTLVAAIQLGLAMNGFDAGPGDGLIGPKTRHALNAYVDENKLQPEIDQQLLFDHLFGIPLSDYRRLGVNSDSQCKSLDVVRPAVAKKRSGRGQNVTTRARQRSNAIINQGISIGIGLGLKALQRHVTRRRGSSETGAAAPVEPLD